MRIINVVFASTHEITLSNIWVMYVLMNFIENKHAEQPESPSGIVAAIVSLRVSLRLFHEDHEDEGELGIIHK